MEPTPVYNENIEIPKIELTESMLWYLDQIRKWAFFLSIVAFVGIGFMILGGFSILLGASTQSKTFFGQQSPIPIGLIGFFYIFIALTYLFPVIALFRFALSAKKGIEYRDQNELERTFKYLKSHYMILGIMMIVTVLIYLLLIIGIFAAVAVSLAN